MAPVWPRATPQNTAFAFSGNGNSKWRHAVQPQRNLCAWEIPEPGTPILGHCSLTCTLHHLKQVTWWEQSWASLLPLTPSICWVMWMESFTARMIAYNNKLHSIFAIWWPFFLCPSQGMYQIRLSFPDTWQVLSGWLPLKNSHSNSKLLNYSGTLLYHSTSTLCFQTELSNWLSI